MTHRKSHKDYVLVDTYMGITLISTPEGAGCCLRCRHQRTPCGILVSRILRSPISPCCSVRRYPKRDPSFTSSPILSVVKTHVLCLVNYSFYYSLCRLHSRLDFKTVIKIKVCRYYCWDIVNCNGQLRVRYV